MVSQKRLSKLFLQRIVHIFYIIQSSFSGILHIKTVELPAEILQIFCQVYNMNIYSNFENTGAGHFAIFFLLELTALLSAIKF